MNHKDLSELSEHVDTVTGKHLRNKVRDAIEEWAKAEMEGFPHMRGPLQEMLDSEGSMNTLTDIMVEHVTRVGQSEYFQRTTGRKIYGGDLRQDDPEVDAMLDRWTAVDKALGLKMITVSCNTIQTVEDTMKSLGVKHVLVEEGDRRFSVKRAREVTLKDVLQELDKQRTHHEDHRFFEAYHCRVIRNGKRVIEVFMGS